MILRRALTSVMVLSSVLLAACGEGGNSTATRGDEITILRTNDIDGWDPDGAKLVATFVTLPNVLEGLVRVGTDGVTIEPALAASWTFDAAEPSYTFTLRDGLTFSDGTPLTAEDAAFSATEWAAGKKLGLFFSDIKDATALDERTVKISLGRPSTFLLDFLASGIAPVIPKGYGGRTREQFYQSPVGAGPFVIESYSPGVQTVLTRNPKYHDKKAPALDKVTYRVVSDTSQQLAQFTRGEADIIETIDPALAQQVDERSRVTVNPASKIFDLVFNFKTPLGQDPQFRKAVDLAIDRDQLVKVAFGGLATPARGIVPPGTIGSIGCGCDAYRLDREAAKAALKASSYQGEKLRFLTQATSGESPQVELIRADLAAVGINVEVEQVDIQVVFQKVKNGEYDLGLGSYGNVSPTAGDVIFYQVVTKFYGTGAPADQLLASFDKFAVAADADAKGQAVRELEQWAAQTLPIVPLYSTALVVPVNKRVHGLQVRPYSRYYLAELSVN